MNPFRTFFHWRAAPLVVLGDLCPWLKFLLLSGPEPCSGLFSWMGGAHKSLGRGAALPTEAACNLVNPYRAAAFERRQGRTVSPPSPDCAVALGRQSGVTLAMCGIGKYRPISQW